MRWSLSPNRGTRNTRGENTAHLVLRVRNYHAQSDLLACVLVQLSKPAHFPCYVRDSQHLSWDPWREALCWWRKELLNGARGCPGAFDFLISPWGTCDSWVNSPCPKHWAYTPPHWLQRAPGDGLFLWDQDQGWSFQRHACTLPDSQGQGRGCSAKGPQMQVWASVGQLTIVFWIWEDKESISSLKLLPSLSRWIELLRNSLFHLPLGMKQFFKNPLSVHI